MYVSAKSVSIVAFYKFCGIIIIEAYAFYHFMLLLQIASLILQLQLLMDRKDNCIGA